MKTQLSHCLLILAFLSTVASAQQPNEKAVRYLEPLLKRPGSGPLFERFVDAWLDSDTLDNLEKYLAAKVQSGDTTADRLLYAVFLSRQGETVKALEQFRAALAKEPGSADIWYQKAVVEARTLDFDSAIASLRKARESRPAAALALQSGQLLGRLLARSGRTDEALKVWQELMAARPDDAELREDVLELQIAEGLHAAAQTTAEELVKGAKDPYKKILYRLRLGDVYDRAGSRDKALETYASCLADAGADSWLEKEISAQLEKLFRREDDLAGLKVFYARLLEKEPQRLGLRRAQAKLLVEMGDTEGAVAAGRELLKLAPGNRAVQEEFITLLAGAQKLPEAIAQLEELRKQSPNDGELLLRLAALQNDSGKKKEAAELIQAFVKLTGDDASRLRASGLLERCGLAEEAAAVLRESQAPALRQSLASVLHKSGKKDEAIAEWKRLGSTGPAAALEAARAMSAHDESGAAWDLLLQIAPQAENDAALLTALCQAAERTDHAAEALPWARKLVARATLPADVESALDITLKLARRAEKTEDLQKELAGASTAQEFALLAALREEARDSAGAEDALKKAEAASPEIAAALLVRLYSQRADFVQAAQALQRLFGTPGGRKAHHAQSLTDLWTRAGSTEKALAAAREWRQLAPGSTAPVLAEARLLQSAGRDAESLEVLRRAAGQFEGNDEIRSRLAEAYRDSGRMADAMRIYSSLYENATELSVKMRWLQGWAQTAELSGRTQDLVEQFEERRRASRDSIVPLLALAEIHRAANNYDGRRKALTEAARLKQNDAELSLEIARLEAREDNEDAAIRTLRAALPSDKTGAVRQELVLLLLRTGERDEGLRLLSEGQADALKDPAVVESVASGLMMRDTGETALSFLTPHLAAHPDDYRLQFLAAQLEMEEKPEAAKARLLRVLALRTELPPARLKALQGFATVRDAESSDYIAMFKAVLTPQAADIVSFSLSSQRAQRSVRNRNRQSSAGPLPDDLDEAHAAAAGLLLSNDQFAGNDPDELLREMERAGFATARIMRETGVRDFSSLFESRSTAIKEAIAAKPDDETLLALAALTQMMNWNEEPDTEQAGRIWKRFNASRPSLALLGALPCVGGAGAEPWEGEVLTMAEGLAKPEDLLLLAATRALGTPWGGEADRRELRPEVHKRINALLQRWYAGASFTGPLMSQMKIVLFMSLAQGFAKGGDAAGFARLLDEEAAAPASVQQQQSVSNMFGGGRQRGVSQALGFPPRALASGLSPLLVSYLGSSGDEDSSFIGRSRVGPDFLREVAEKVKHPLVRLLTLAASGDDDAAGRKLEELLAAPEPDALTYLLAASWAEHRNDYERAVTLAKKALFLPLSRETRKSLDAAFLHWSENDRSNETVRLAAREAALRMRRDALTPESRQQLIAAMDSLGLTSEAEKLASLDAAAQPSGGVSSPYSPPAQTVLTPSAKLLAAGKKSEALPLLVKELQAFGREALKPSGWTGVRSFDEWQSTLKQYAMVPAVMKAVVPPENADAKTLALYGAILDLMGEAKKAAEALKKAVAAGSTEHGVRFRLFKLIAADDPKGAARLMIELPPDLRGNVIGSISSRPYPGGSGAYIGAYNSGYADEDDYSPRVALAGVLDRAEVLDEFIATVPAAELADCDWMGTALRGLAVAASVSRGWMAPSLYAENWSKPLTEREFADQTPGRMDEDRPRGNVPELDAEAAKRVGLRGEIFDRMVQKLLAVPGTASEAWQALRLRQVTDSSDSLPPALFDAGVAAIVLDLSEKPAKPGTRSRAPSDRAWWRAVNTLMPEAVKAGRTADLETRVMAAVRERHKPREIEALERDWALYSCPEAEFPGKAREAVTKTRGEAWDTVFETALVRRLGAELAEELITWMEPRVKSGQDVRSAANAMTRAARLLDERKGREAVDQWLRGAWQRLTGTREERAKAMASMDEDGDIPGRAGLSLRWMTWAMAQVQEVPSLVFLAMKIQEEEYDALIPEKLAAKLEDYSDSGRTSWKSAALQHVQQLLKENKIKELAEWLKDSPFLGSPENFRSANGLFSGVAQLLRRAGMDQVMRLGIMGSADSLTFGQALLGAGTQENRPVAVCNAVQRWRGELAALPVARRTELVSLLRDWAATHQGAPEGLTAEGLAFFKWLETAGEEEKLAGVDGEVDKFLDPKNLRELRSNRTWEFESKLRELLVLLVRAGSPRAAEVVEKVRESAQMATRQPDRNPLSEALRGVLNEFSSDAKLLGKGIALVLYAATAPGEGVLPVNWELVGELADAGDDLGRRYSDPVARMKAAADILTPHVPAAHSPLLLPLLWQLMETGAGQDELEVDKECEKILAWIKGPGTKAIRPDLAEVIGATASLLQHSTARPDERRSRGVTEVEKLPPGLLYFSRRLQDPQLSSNLRLLLATLVIRQDPWQTEEVVLRQAVDALQQAVKDKVPVQPWQETMILEALTLPPGPLTGGVAEVVVPLLKMGRSVNSLQDDIDRRGVRALLSAALRSGNAEAANRVVRSFGDYFDSQMLALLARYGTPEQLRTLVRPGRQRLFIENSTRGSANVVWSDALATPLDASLAGVEQEDLRYLARLAVHSLPVPEQPVELPASPAGPRLAALAAEFSKVAFREVALRERALELLAAEPEAAAVVAGPVQESLEGISISTIHSLRDANAKRRKSVMYFASLSNAAARGDFAMLESAVRELLAPPAEGRRENSPSYLLESCLAAAGNGLMKDWEKKKELLEKACPVWRSVLARPEFSAKLRAWPRTALFTALLHAMANRMDDLHAWRESLPPEVRKSLDEGMGRADLANLLTTDYSYRYDGDDDLPIQMPAYKLPQFTGGGATPQIRDEVFLRFISSPLSGQPADPVEQFTEAKWGSEAEALKLEEQWCAAAPREGQTALGFALHHKNAGDHARMLAAAERGLKAVRASRNGRGFSLLALRIEALYRLQRSSEGTEAFLKIAGLSPEHLEDAGDRREAERAWSDSLRYALSGPPRENGSLADTLRIASLVHEREKGNAAFWTGLQEAGIHAAEKLLAGGQLPPAQAAAALALRAGGMVKKTGGVPNPDFMEEAKSVLSGAAPLAPVLSADAPWRWMPLTAEPAEAWRSAGFDDSGWQTGTGPFGFGDDGLKTEITSSAPGGNAILSWGFRTEFEIADPARVSRLVLKLRVDDGGVVWLNGKEAGRRNLPDGAVRFDTLAAKAVNQADEGRLESMVLDARQLVPGKNCIAVQVHQQRPDSSDAAFHAILEQSGGSAGPAAEPDKAILLLEPQLKECPEGLRKALQP